MSSENSTISAVSIIERAKGSARMASLIGEDANNVRAWKRNNSIPAHAFKAIVDAGLASYIELATAAESRKAA